MKNRIFLTSLLIGSMVLGSATLFAQNPTEHGRPEPQGAEPPVGGVQWARGQAGHPAGAGGVKLLQWFGGPVQHGTVVTPIFWGTSWANDTSDKINGLKEFYKSVGGTSYAATNGEYYDGPNSFVSTVVSLNTAPSSYVDSSQSSGGNSTSTILAEVCKVYPNPIPGGYYPVYSDTPRGSAGYCAWHSAGSCGGIPIQFGFFFKLDGDTGCDPGGSTGSYTANQTNSQGLAALANVSGHELSEMLTDPKLNAWYDRQGSENSDKCAWTFGSSLLTFAGGSTWKVQGNWSNAAYNSSQGYTQNGTKVRGCIDGTN